LLLIHLLMKLMRGTRWAICLGNSDIHGKDFLRFCSPFLLDSENLEEFGGLNFHL
jgi:hypothetical protein